MGHGSWVNGYVFIYPDSREDWWVMAIEPSPTPGVPGDHYIDDGSYLENLASEWELEWIPIGPEEEQLEREVFGWRPLEDNRGAPQRRGWRSIF
jgi:hypothetical protein